MRFSGKWGPAFTLQVKSVPNEESIARSAGAEPTAVTHRPVNSDDAFPIAFSHLKTERPSAQGVCLRAKFTLASKDV